MHQIYDLTLLLASTYTVVDGDSVSKFGLDKASQKEHVHSKLTCSTSAAALQFGVATAGHWQAHWHCSGQLPPPSFVCSPA